jgi:rhodanese-related sulfurtransferase
MRSVRDIVGAARERIQQVTPADAAEELASGEVTLIDVREPVEWEQHIEGAFQVPRGLLEFVGDPECGPHLPPSLKYEMDPSRRTITYCNSGARATLAAATLKDMGFENVANLDGGLTAWTEAGLPTTEHHAGIV